MNILSLQEQIIQIHSFFIFFSLYWSLLYYCRHLNIWTSTWSLLLWFYQIDPYVLIILLVFMKLEVSRRRNSWYLLKLRFLPLCLMFRSSPKERHIAVFLIITLNLFHQISNRFYWLFPFPTSRNNKGLFGIFTTISLRLIRVKHIPLTILLTTNKRLPLDPWIEHLRSFTLIPWVQCSKTTCFTPWLQWIRTKE